MCECGCTMSDDKYLLPGPGKSIYVLTLSAACVNCDAPSGFTIERLDQDDSLYRNYKRGDFEVMPLVLDKWPDSRGVAIRTGMRKHEFIAATLKHLEGISSKELGGKDGRIDQIGAETILEEMYEDACCKPVLLISAREALNA